MAAIPPAVMGREVVTPLAAALEHERARAGRLEAALADAMAAERIAATEAAALRGQEDERRRWGLLRRICWALRARLTTAANSQHGDTMTDDAEEILYCDTNRIMATAAAEQIKELCQSVIDEDDPLPAATSKANEDFFIRQLELTPDQYTNLIGSGFALNIDALKSAIIKLIDDHGYEFQFIIKPAHGKNTIVKPALRQLVAGFQQRWR